MKDTPQQPTQQQVDLDLDPLISRYGQRIAQAELEAEMARQQAQQFLRRAEQAEQAVQALEARVAHLEDAALEAPDDYPEDDAA